MSETEMSETIQCLNCYIGTLRRGRATYTRWFGGQLIIVPNVGIWVCDICGDFVYDDDAIMQIELLLGESLIDPSPPPRREAPSPDSPLTRDPSHKRA